MEYFLHRDGQQWGPYDEATLRSMLAAQQVLPTDLIWNDQMPDWATVESVFPTSTPVPAPIPAPTPMPTPVAATTPVAAAGKSTATPTEKPTVKAKPDKKEAGKKSSLPKIAGIAVAGLAVVGVVLWFFVFRSTPSAPSITETEIAGSVWVSPDSNGNELQWYFRDNKTFIHVESGVASEGSWEISKGGLELSLKLTNQIGKVNQYVIRKQLGRFIISTPHDTVESELTRMEGSPPIP
jgi:hypothetical protein